MNQRRTIGQFEPAGFAGLGIEMKGGAQIVWHDDSA